MVGSPLARYFQDRFESVGHLEVLQLVDSRLFIDFVKAFPDGKLEKPPEYYPMIGVNRLKTVLGMLYDRKDFHTAKSWADLLQFMVENNLSEPFFRSLSSLGDYSSHSLGLS